VRRTVTQRCAACAQAQIRSTDAGVDACSGLRSDFYTVLVHSPFSRVRCAQDCGLSCFAAFKLGSPSSTTCPASYARLDTAAACKSAADAATGAFGGNVALSYYPYGCYWHTVTGSVYYNTNAAGAANFYAQPLCAGAALTHISRDRHCACTSHASTLGRCGGTGADVQPCRRYDATSVAAMRCITLA
jgi:hypothetical protein